MIDDEEEVNEGYIFIRRRKIRKESISNSFGIFYWGWFGVICFILKKIKTRKIQSVLRCKIVEYFKENRRREIIFKEKDQ